MMESSKVEVDGLQIAFHDTGGKGCPIVFVHGNSASKKVFQKQMQSSLSSEYRLIAFDLPGHGDSGRGDVSKGAYTLAYFTQTLAGFCRELDCEDAILVGSSLGGHIVMESTPLLPEVRGLMVFGAPPHENPPRMAEAFLPTPIAALIFNEELSDEDIVIWGRTQYPGYESIPDFFGSDVRRADPGFRPALGACVVKLQFLDEVEIVRNLKCPLAILHGTEETVVNLNYINELNLTNLWKGEAQLISGAAHMIQWEKAEEFNAMLAEFVTDCCG